MFKLKRIKTFAATVHVSLPTEVPDKTQEGQFVAHFKFVDTAQYVDGLSRLKASAQDYAAGLVEVLQLKRELLEEVLVRIEGIGDEDGNPLPAEEARAAVLDSMPMLNQTYDAFLTHYQGAPGKTSKPSRTR